MRITDIVTPQELRQIYEKDSRTFESFGHRQDLAKLYCKSVADRLNKEYCKVLSISCDSVEEACAIHRLLALLDQFLEEKYANSKHAD